MMKGYFQRLFHRWRCDKMSGKSCQILD